MELRQLRYLAAVARHGSFTLAAQELHVAQPAVSQQVRRLEQELGVELLSRTTRRVLVTEAGELALARAGRILADADALREEIDELHGLLRGTLALGVIPAVGALDPAPLLARFRARHPAVDIRLIETTLAETLDQLRADRLDVCFAFCLPERAGEGIAGERLFDEELALMVASGHPLAARRRVRLESLAGEPLIAPIAGASLRLALDEALEKAGAPVHVAYESNEAATVRALTAQGLGVSVLPRSFADNPGPELVPIAIVPKLPRVPVSVLYREGRRRPPAVEAFLSGVREELSAA
ncbi:MAG TPA: LysR substrate-binding domain-containing protein [Thermoleophilaceae bacterium]|jgi:DNA-binding transcriptional LysR family regulator